jgi:hypothetical protein
VGSISARISRWAGPIIDVQHGMVKCGRLLDGSFRIGDKPGTIQKTSAPCRFGRLLPVAAELVERVERNHFDEPEVPVSLDGHPSSGEQ